MPSIRSEKTFFLCRLDTETFDRLQARVEAGGGSKASIFRCFVASYMSGDFRPVLSLPKPEERNRHGMTLSLKMEKDYGERFRSTVMGNGHSVSRLFMEFISSPLLETTNEDRSRKDKRCSVAIGKELHEALQACLSGEGRTFGDLFREFADYYVANRKLPDGCENATPARSGSFSASFAWGTLHLGTQNALYEAAKENRQSVPELFRMYSAWYLSAKGAGESRAGDSGYPSARGVLCA